MDRTNGDSLCVALLDSPENSGDASINFLLQVQECCTTSTRLYNKHSKMFKRSVFVTQDFFTVTSPLKPTIMDMRCIMQLYCSIQILASRDLE